MAVEKKAEKKPASQKFGDDRKKALEVALGKIEKDFGKGSVMKLGSANAAQVEVIPTGSLQLDFALGVGGLPKGRIVEIYGPESSGKTTVALHCIAQAQKAGGTAAFIDAEHALDPVYAHFLPNSPKKLSPVSCQVLGRRVVSPSGRTVPKKFTGS